MKEILVRLEYYIRTDLKIIVIGNMILIDLAPTLGKRCLNNPQFHASSNKTIQSIYFLAIYRIGEIDTVL